MSQAEYHQVLLQKSENPGHEPYIADDDDDDLDADTQRHPRGSIWRALRYCQQTAPKLNRWILVTQCILLFVNIALISLIRSGKLSGTNNKDLLYSPLSPVITHEVKAFITDEDHLWTGTPNPKTEENWHKMLQGFDVRVTKTDMQRLGRLDNAVEINDERGGYVALINVYHELHCLKLIRWSLYPDYFYPNSSRADTMERERHRDHCINYIRQSAMCHADVGLSTWHWRNNDPMPHADMMPHTCRNWDAVDVWAKERKVDMYSPGLLVHPKFGAPFPKGLGANEDDGGS